MENKRLDFDLGFLERDKDDKKSVQTKEIDKDNFDKENREVLKVASIIAILITVIVIIAAYLS